MPSITINMVINIIGGLKLFDVIIALTAGGPGNASQSMSTFMYDLYFKRQDAGYAATQGIFMAFVILIISFARLRTLKERRRKCHESRPFKNLRIITILAAIVAFAHFIPFTSC